MQPQQVNLPPTYQEILKAMGEQLKQRKGALMKRVLLIVWPFILLFVIGYVFEQFVDLKTWSQPDVIKLIIVAAICIFLSAVYVAVVKYIFSIEKRIWVDSFFDGKNLSLPDSWRIAKKLFWPALVFRIKLWLQYYFFPLALVIIVYAALIFITARNVSTYDVVSLVWVGLFVVGVVALIIYGYYMRVKLRYSWFVFLDKFGTTDSYSIMRDEMIRLNKVSKTETFKKSLIANLGTDTVNALAQLIVGILSGSINVVGGFINGAAGRALGGIVQVYGQELARQAAELANISAQYILYRFARKEVYGSEQHVNEELYR